MTVLESNKQMPVVIGTEPYCWYLSGILQDTCEESNFVRTLFLHVIAQYKRLGLLKLGVQLSITDEEKSP